MAHLVLNNLRRWNKKYFLNQTGSSDHFLSLDWITSFQIFFKHIPEGKIEIACHPEREEEFEIIEKYFENMEAILLSIATFVSPIPAAF